MTGAEEARFDAFKLDGHRDEAVVLIHGFTGVPAHFRPLAEHLHLHGFTVTVPRLAGHGTSVEDLATTGAGDWISSAAAAAAAVSHNRRVHLVGLSMGGLISLILAGSTAAATITTINAPIRFRDRRIWLTPLLAPVRKRIEWPPEEPPEYDPELEPYRFTYTGFPTAAAADLLRISRRALVAARRLRRPALVVQSTHDETVAPVSGLILHRALGRRCRLVWLERSRHNALLDQERNTLHREVLATITKGPDTGRASGQPATS